MAERSLFDDGREPHSSMGVRTNILPQPPPSVTSEAATYSLRSFVSTASESPANSYTDYRRTEVRGQRRASRNFRGEPAGVGDSLDQVAAMR